MEFPLTVRSYRPVHWHSRNWAMTIRKNGRVGSFIVRANLAVPPSSATAGGILAFSDEYVASHDFRHAPHELQDVVPHPVRRDLV